MTNNSLLHLNVLITRPLQDSIVMQNSIKQAGGNPILFPALEIKILNNNYFLNSILTTMHQYDVALFLSKNAAKFVAPLWNQNNKLLVGAIGPSTKAVLDNHLISVSICPEKNFNSEGLLQTLLCSQKVSKKKILLFSGEGGRSWLEENLQREGAQVTKVPVYKRELPEVDEASLHVLKKNLNAPYIIIVTSCESLRNLEILFKQSTLDKWFRAAPLLVVSERIKSYAIELGFHKESLFVAANATDQAILDTLIKWYSNLKCTD